MNSLVTHSRDYLCLKWAAGLALAAMACLYVGCNSVEEKESTVVGSVTLNISFADESKPGKEMIVNCAAQSTVFSLMETAKANGDLEFEHRQNLSGALESIFIESIEGVGNDSGKYWTYAVNDELAKQGCGTKTVGPNDRVCWVFGQPVEQLLAD